MNNQRLHHAVRKSAQIVFTLFTSVSRSRCVLTTAHRRLQTIRFARKTPRLSWWFETWCRPILTSCRRAAATICPAPVLPLWTPKRLDPPSTPQRSVSHAEYVPTLTAAAAWRVKAAMSKAACWPWPFDLESGVRVACEVGYPCANFGLPRPLCSRLRPDERDRQTDVRQKHRLMPPLIRGGGTIMYTEERSFYNGETLVTTDNTCPWSVSYNNVVSACTVVILASAWLVRSC